MYNDGNPFFKMFADLVLQAWEARQAIFGSVGEQLTPPTIVTSIQQKNIEIERKSQASDTKPSISLLDLCIGTFPVSSMARNLDNQNPFYSSGGPPAADLNDLGSGLDPDILRTIPLDVGINDIDWNSMDWGVGSVYPGA